MNPKTPRNEIARLAYATRNSLKGYGRVFRDEAAFRMQFAVLIVAVPVALWLAQSWFQFAVLVASWALVLVAELGNSSIEAAVDRIGHEQHDLAGKAKDAGSAMVMTAMLIAALVWAAVIVDRLT
ncbi:MAG: diacylglycerol kinase [Wenzhouxiangellaceae bacterium]|nr:diacylglycerol kinase [Wenzhouxiangellaceae bacterium]MBS3747044.1 diacylglycerol kinase [Wenzhouxiangellaceae bacterium]MBS3823844.1 diacylglycerol kinase [Wenzhouxiangellaceae bacterium]